MAAQPQHVFDQVGHLAHCAVRRRGLSSLGLRRPAATLAPAARCRREREGGFSLIEVILTVAILGLVMTLVYQFQVVGMRAYKAGAARGDAEESARTVLYATLTDLRQGRAFVVVPGTYHYVQLRFNDPNNHTIVYSLGANDATVYRSVDGVSQPVAGNISSLTFDFSADYRVITVTVSSVARDGQQIVVAAEVYRRNP